MDSRTIDLSEPHRLEDILGADPMISPHSRWSDEFWEFDVDAPGYSARKLRVSWRVDATPLVLDQMKYLGALLWIGRLRGSALKASGAAKHAVGMRYLLRFMRERHFTSMAELDASTFDMFKDQIKRELVDPSGLSATDRDEPADRIESASGKREGGPDAEDYEEWMFAPTSATTAPIPTGSSGDEQDISVAMAYTRLTIWRNLVEHADDLRNAGIDLPSLIPFSDRSAIRMAKEIGARSAESIPPLPDLVARPILEVAHRLTGAPAEDVIRLHEDYFAARASRIDGETDWHRTNRLNRIVMEFPFTPLEAGGQPWRSVSAQLRATSGAGIVRDLVTLIRDAAVIVLQSDTGMRISEICSIEIEDTDDQDGLPSCITTATSQTQLNEHFFVHGRLSKGLRRPREEKWLVGGRPRGTTVESPSVRAVRVLGRLLRPWRRLSVDDRWSRQLIPSAASGSLPSEPCHVGQTIGYALTRSMKGFIEREVDLKARLAHLVPANPDIAQYVKENGRCVRAHQWRKTFIRYLIRVDEDLLPAISQHFKHYTLAITEDGYMPKDPEMFEAADSVRTRETSRALFQRRFRRDMRLSQLDGLLAESRSRIAEVIGGAPFERAAPRLDAFVNEHDLQFWFARHGACLIDLNPQDARCHQQMGVSDWKPRSPNFTTRNPETCLGCRNFSAGPETVGFWRDRYVDNQTSWISSGYQPSFRVARMRAKQSAVVLRHLRQPLPMILARAPGRGKFNNGGDPTDA